jgi:ABC-type phosphate transport system substrate-binding protein
MKRNSLKLLLLAVLAGAAGAPVQAADVVVVVNKANPNTPDKAFIARLYTGEARSWPDGPAAALIDQAEDSPVRADFSSQVLGRSVSNLKAAWAQLIFTGKGLPPKVIDGDAEVKRAVAANRNAIGYIKAGSVDDTVKVILK